MGMNSFAGNPAPDPATDILAGARNAPRIRVLPADLSGVPDPVRRAFQSPDVQGSFFPAETPEMAVERKQLEAQGATGFYLPDKDEAWVRSGLDPATERFTAYHEVAGHYGLGGSMGKDYDQVMALAKGNPTVARLAQAMAGGSTNYASAQANNEDVNHMSEEALAELAAAHRTGDYSRVESKWGVQIPHAERSGFIGTMARVVQQTKRKLGDLTGHHPDSFNDEQVYRLIENAWRYVQRPRPMTPAESDAEKNAAAMGSLEKGIAAANVGIQR